MAKEAKQSGMVSTQNTKAEIFEELQRVRRQLANLKTNAADKEMLQDFKLLRERFRELHDKDNLTCGRIMTARDIVRELIPGASLHHAVVLRILDGILRGSSAECIGSEWAKDKRIDREGVR